MVSTPVGEKEVAVELGENETLEDLMIGGYKIVQNKNLYRFSSDSVLLSRFASGRKGDIVADLCAGSGIVGLHFFALNEKTTLSVDFFELQQELSTLCQRTIEYNGFSDKMRCFCGRAQDAGKELNGKYSLVLCNPPYQKKGGGIRNPESSIALCRHEIAITLDEILATASRLLGFGGRLCICHRAERLCDLLCGMREHGLEPCTLRFVYAGSKEEPYLVLAEGRKGKSPAFRILPPLRNSATETVV